MACLVTWASGYHSCGPRLGRLLAGSRPGKASRGHLGAWFPSPPTSESAGAPGRPSALWISFQACAWARDSLGFVESSTQASICWCFPHRPGGQDPSGHAQGGRKVERRARALASTAAQKLAPGSHSAASAFPAVRGPSLHAWACPGLPLANPKRALQGTWHFRDGRNEGQGCVHLLAAWSWLHHRVPEMQ